MQWNDHSRLTGQHAFLGASKYHWLNYDADRLVETYLNYQAKERGTRLHAFAAECIALNQKLPKSKKTLNAYVNDAIAYNEKDHFLRIHDLKTGAVPAHMEQLFIYAALFCLEYRIKPKDIQIETRIYQNDDIWTANPTAEDIDPIIEKIKEFDKVIMNLKMEAAA